MAKKNNTSIDLEYLWNYLKNIFLTKADFSNKMDKSVYDTNDNGKVDESESVTCDDVIIRFGIDSNGNYGYKKAGADTVTPFKTGSDPKLQIKIANPATSQQRVSPDTGYDALEAVIVEPVQGNALASDVRYGKKFSSQNGINLTGTYETILQSKTVAPSGQQQVVVPDSGYDGLESVIVSSVSLQSKSNINPSDVMVIVQPDTGYVGLSQVSINPAERQEKSVTPTNQQQIITPDSGYYGLSKVTVDGVNIQSNKTVSPSGQQQVVVPDSGYDGLEQVTVNAIRLQSKSNINPSESMVIVQPDSNYDGLSQVSINPAERQEKTVTPSTSQQVITPDSGYYGLSRVTVNAISLNLQEKTTTVTPSANWSGSETSAATVFPDSGYDGMSRANVKVPMLRDGTLMTPTGVSTPSTVYNGDTSQSNGDKCLRMEPTKAGMSYPSSYLYLKPNSYLGDAAASDVRSGKTFSSSNGIQVTGTWNGGSSYTQSKTGWATFWDTQSDIVPDSGYTLSSVKIQPFSHDSNPNKRTLWTGSATSQFAAQTITLSSAYTNYRYIRIIFNVNKNKTTENYVEWLMKVAAITAMNSTSSNNFDLCSKAISSDGATSGSMYYRPFRFASSTTITFAAATTAGGSGSSNVLIPVKIEGWI